MYFKGCFLSILVLFIFDVVSGCVERTAPAATWDINNYPNPQKVPEKCGRNATSFLCDPDGLLTRTQASDLDNLLQEISSSGPCLCAETCTEKTGIKIFIALLARVKSDGDAKLSDLEAFTTGLKDVSWNFGSCGDDIYIAVSDYDMMVYVRTGSQTQKFINDECIKEVIKDTKPLLCNSDYYNFLHDMIIQYRNMSSASINGSTTRCKTEVSASKTLKIVLLVVFVGLPATSFLVIFTIFFCPVFCNTLPCTDGYDIDCDPCCCCRLCVSKDKYTASADYTTGRSGGVKRSGVDSTTNRDWGSSSVGGYTGGNSSSNTSHHIDFSFGGSGGGNGGGGGGGGGGGDCC